MFVIQSFLRSTVFFRKHISMFVDAESTELYVFFSFSISETGDFISWSSYCGNIWCQVNLLTHWFQVMLVSASLLKSQRHLIQWYLIGLLMCCSKMSEKHWLWLQCYDWTGYGIKAKDEKTIIMLRYQSWYLNWLRECMSFTLGMMETCPPPLL